MSDKTINEEMIEELALSVGDMARYQPSQAPWVVRGFGEAVLGRPPDPPRRLEKETANEYKLRADAWQIGYSAARESRNT